MTEIRASILQSIVQILICVQMKTVMIWSNPATDINICASDVVNQPILTNSMLP
jgi:hypothetical protein